MQPPLETIGQVIQWASNAQMDLLHTYTQQWGFAAKADIWENYTALLKAELPLLINTKSLPAKSQKALIAFLSDPSQDYHLEMSTDEMAMMFLRFLEKD